MISFNHGDKSYSLGPSAILEDDPYFINSEKDTVEGENKNNNIKSKLLDIDGIHHTIYEKQTPSQNKKMDEGKFLYLKKNCFSKHLLKFTKIFHYKYKLLLKYFISNTIIFNNRNTIA